MTNDLSIDGASPEDTVLVRSLLAAMAPTSVPNRIVFLPSKQYTKVRTQVEMGRFGGQSVGSGAGSDERFGARHTIVGNGFSLVGPGQTYLNADLLKKPNDLRDILAHELGHYHAASVGGDASEETADRQKAVYVQRAQQAQRTWNGVQNLPDNAMGVLSGALKGIQATPASPLVEIAGTQPK